MRTVINNDNLMCTGTPKYHFKGDRVFYDFHTKGAGKNITVIATLLGENYKINSTIGLVRMDLTDVVNKANYGNISINFRVDIEGAPVYFADAITYGNGKTLRGRTHGATSHIMANDNVNYIDVFVLGACTIKTPLATYTPREMGVVRVENTRRENWQISVKYKEKQIIGALGDIIGTTEHNITVERFCVPGGWCMVSYSDVDGCRRDVPAKIISNDLEIEPYEYTPVTNEIISQVRNIIGGGKQQIRVGIPNVVRGQYLEDILLSEHIDVGDNAQYLKIPVSIATKQISKSMNTDDIILTFKLLNL